jgi:hypothetical protein
VGLRWKSSPENEYVNITGYQVWRKDNSPDAEWKPIATVQQGETFLDTTVVPRSRYWYRLRESAVAQLGNPVIVRDKTDLPVEERDLYGEDTREPVETPSDIYVTVDGGDAQKGTVECRVWRWSSAEQAFLSKTYPVSVGAKIGQRESDGDFATEAVLSGVTVEKRKGRAVIVARVRWPWMTEKDKLEEIVEGEAPAD